MRTVILLSAMTIATAIQDVPIEGNQMQAVGIGLGLLWAIFFDVIYLIKD